MSTKLKAQDAHNQNANQRSLETILIKHPTWEASYREISRVHQYARNGVGGMSVMILGESGAGKTSLLDHYQAAYPDIEHQDRTQIRVLRIDAPAKPTEMTLSQATLTALGDPFSNAKITATEKTERVIKLLNAAGVELIMLDELQHVLNSPKGEDESITWIKTLMNRTNKSFVIAGLPSCRQLVQKHTQLRKRLSGQIMLSPFSVESRDGRSLYAGVWNQLDKCMPFEYAAVDMGQFLVRKHFATAGSIGYMKKLAIRLRDVVAERGGGQVTIEDWKEAFRREIWVNAPDLLNPFSEEFCFRPLNRPGEPFEDLWPFQQNQKKAA